MNGDDELLRELIHNPMLSGLVAIGLNQAAYRAGLWDVRPSADGRTYTYVRTWGIDAQGIHFGDPQWQAVDREQIAAQNATIIGTALIAAMVAYAAKAPVIQTVPVLGVKA